MLLTDSASAGIKPMGQPYEQSGSVPFEDLGSHCTHLGEWLRGQNPMPGAEAWFWGCRIGQDRV